MKWPLRASVFARAISQARTGTTRFLASSLLAILFVALLTLGVSQNIAPPQARDSYEDVTPQDIAVSRSRAVIGIFIQKIYDYNPQTKVFAADGYLWLRWKDQFPSWDKHVAADPVLSIEFLNAVEQWDFAKTLSPDDPYVDSDGWHYQSIVFSGKFLASDINLSRFPFESIVLPIEIGTNDFWSSQLLFEPDEKQSLGILAKDTLQGYSLVGADFHARKHRYNSSMGLRADAQKEFGYPDTAVFPNFVAQIEFQRVFSASAWQLFLPLSVVTLLAFLTPVVDARATEAKITLPASVILALVFLQQGYKEMLPHSLTYLTFMDKVYTAVYLATLAIVIETIWVANGIARLPDADKAYAAQRFRRIESRNNLFILSALSVSLLLLFRSQ